MTETATSSEPSTFGDATADNELLPRVMRIRGGFLALTPGDLWPRIGVTGPSEEEAALGFKVAWARWQQLLSEDRLATSA